MVKLPLKIWIRSSSILVMWSEKRAISNNIIIIIIIKNNVTWSKKFLHVLAAANKKMDLHVKVHHNQKHQIYCQVSFTLQESIPISYRHQLQKFCQLSALLILAMGLFPFHKIILPCSIPWPLPPFSLICDFPKQNTRGNVSKISVNHTCYSTDRIEIHPIAVR